MMIAHFILSRRVWRGRGKSEGNSFSPPLTFHLRFLLERLTVLCQVCVFEISFIGPSSLLVLPPSWTLYFSAFLTLFLAIWYILSSLRASFDSRCKTSLIWWFSYSLTSVLQVTSSEVRLSICFMGVLLMHSLIRLYRLTRFLRSTPVLSLWHCLWSSCRFSTWANALLSVGDEPPRIIGTLWSTWVFSNQFVALLSSRLTVLELYIRGSSPVGRELTPWMFSCHWLFELGLVKVNSSESTGDIGPGFNALIRFSKFWPSHLNTESQSIRGLEHIEQDSFWRESRTLFTSFLWLATKIALATYGRGFRIRDEVICSVVG